MFEKKVQYGDIIINKYSFEHLLWTECHEIDGLRNEILINEKYYFFRQDLEKYIRDLLRFFILKFYHRDYSSDNEYEDIIVPFNDNLDNLWVLFLSHIEEYTTFMQKMSSELLDGEEIILRRKYDLIVKNNSNKTYISRLQYKNRYSTFPDIDLKTEKLIRLNIENRIDYFQGTLFNNGHIKDGILKYTGDNEEDLVYGSPLYLFIGTFNEEDESISSGNLYLKDGSIIKFEGGEEVEDYTSDNRSETSSVTM